MQKLITFILPLLIVSSISAQTQVEIMRERKWIVQQTKQELNTKVNKETKKEAKRLKKEGWKVAPGALPLEKQLERSYLMHYEYDANLFPKYIMANAQSIGENYDNAKTTAMALAITNLAEQIQTEVMAVIENTMLNQQITAEDATSITETVKASKNLIAQSIGRVITVVECYRVLDNNNREVMVRVAYNGDTAKQTLYEKLENRSQHLYNQLNLIFGL